MLERGCGTDGSIVVIDDNDANRLFLRRVLERAGYSRLTLIGDPRQALEECFAVHPDLIILDLQMPHLSGFDLMGQFQENLPDWENIPVLVFTADAAAETRRRALEMGASDFLTKPGDPNEIVLRVRNFLRTRQLYLQLQRQNERLEYRVRERTHELEEAQIEIIERLARAAEFRDDEVGEHAARVGELAAQIATMLGLPFDEVELIRLAAPLHDVGKIGIEDTILLKPGRLSDSEFSVMKSHAEIGERILEGSRSPLLQLAEQIAATHHERWDGSGYPKGLVGEEIPLVGRIVAVADVYDALTNVRPYKEAWTHERTLNEIIKLSGSHFDPRVVDAFLRVVQQPRHVA